jgi:hypothetical protein
MRWCLRRRRLSTRKSVAWRRLWRRSRLPDYPTIHFPSTFSLYTQWRRPHERYEASRSAPSRLQLRSAKKLPPPQPPQQQQPRPRRFLLSVRTMSLLPELSASSSVPAVSLLSAPADAVPPFSQARASPSSNCPTNVSKKPAKS